MCGSVPVQWALQVQSPYTKILVEAAIRHTGTLEVHGGQANGSRGSGFNMLPLV